MAELLASLDARVALALHATAAAVLIAAVLAVAAVLRARGPDAYGIYESGAPATGPTTIPVPASYFQIAAFFVIFDFEAAVLYTWAVSARQAGTEGLIAAAIFIGLLLAALVYLWADGALRTGPEPRKPLP